MIKRFLDYVEIRTKITSLFAFVMSLGLLLYKDQTMNLGNTLVFFCSMFLIDLATTAINNYIDTKDGNLALPFNRKTALFIIYALLFVGGSLGIILAYRTDLVVLFVGGLCFLCGVFYTYGPIPISRQPLGEVLSGVFYGLFIPFLMFYINTPAGTFLEYRLSFEEIDLKLKIVPIIALLLFAAVPFCCTANIMLANNMCDVEKDIKVKRHTLPYYIGKNSIRLFAGLYYSCYAAILLMCIVKILSPLCLLALLTIYPVEKNIRLFRKKQVKSETFVVSIKNYITIMGSVTLLLFISILMK
ncbi:1,4-dihydroxy-2-naphthoate octaprenyltransferase [Anaerocolumna jejuensis DSM 15929]|uniref:1,4-dihydroxy-2-naphthoate octaprenyltransferase n=1 Tax=Anaerocolumna jejuensis DSM 15929 TaxID=1121322 RepID=A0A1M7AY35_9FIRM|nr:UbiA family prenyltransferase [Anaerocolumna jejuensis]SHL47670.1 1,4-dihydroxy-2-naphthoate octaprenyltransferase [Anaerocolumna jejuensis DSM 15929]